MTNAMVTDRISSAVLAICGYGLTGWLCKMPLLR